MILSMTGYGKAEGTIGTRKFTVELRSLNSKQFDLNVRMPSMFKEKEMALRTFLAKEVGRGKSDLTIFYEASAEEKKVAVNKPLMLSYQRDFKEVAEAFGQENPDYLGAIMRIPDVLRPEKEELNEDEWSQIMELVKTALEGFIAYRTQEGAVLYHDFKSRINAILNLQEELSPLITARVERTKDRIKNNLNEWIEADKIDTNRFEQEMIYYLEKMDVTEELVRLTGNCNYFLEILEDGTMQGKKLGFISQEIGREVNTLGSKANDAEMQRRVVQMKDELEKIKEQILNVL
jgi:uncharacterized protein (TIGR00255 family)